MGLLKKKSDPISERARALQTEIATIETQIKQLHAHLEQQKSQPRWKSTALPAGQMPSTRFPATEPEEPHFEAVDRKPLAKGLDIPAADAPARDLELGENRFQAFWQRLVRQWRGPDSHNPKLVSYLAAGSIKGLRPLRYEKRVARNRFLALFSLLLLLLWGIFAYFQR